MTKLSDEDIEKKRGSKKDHDAALKTAIAAVDGEANLARELGIATPTIYGWKRVPWTRVLQIEAVTGIRREVLRPDLYPPDKDPLAMAADTPFDEADRRMTANKMPAELGALIVQQIRNALDAMDRHQRSIEAKIKELEAKGFRIITVDDTGTITDWRTGEFLAEDFSDDDPENWANIEYIEDETFDATPEPVVVEGLSKCLGSVIVELATEHQHELRSWLAVERGITEDPKADE